MTFFYMHLETPVGPRQSLGAVEFDSFESAYIDACASLPDLACDLLKEGVDPSMCSLMICDSQDALLMSVQVRDIVKGTSINAPQRSKANARVVSLSDELRSTDLRARDARKALAEAIDTSRNLIAESKSLLSRRWIGKVDASRVVPQSMAREG